MEILNLGIMAHVDAGKTSLTERLLYDAGVIDELGSVDAGSTRTDTLELERRRGITIKSAVVAFELAGVATNLIDTPGHPDFIAEVERVLSVLDGAVLVVSAVEGVQPQTRVLMRTLRRLRIPTLIFVNKIDRAGAQPDRVRRDLAEKLTPSVIAMGTVRNAGGRAADFMPFGAEDVAFSVTLAELLAEHSDAFLTAYLDDASVMPYTRMMRELIAQTRQALVYPVFFGSAITGAGVAELASGIAELLPAAGRDAAGPVAGAVFKIERGASGEKVAYVRMFSGTVRTRDRLQFGQGGEGKVTAISVFEGGTVVQRPAVAAGQIGVLTGLAAVRIGDSLGAGQSTAGRQLFTPPTLETVVDPCCSAERGALRAALEQLAEQDPLINLRQNDRRQELFVSLYGEVQKEVIQATLADDFNIAVTFRETTTICIERPNAGGAAVEFKREGPNPFLATVGLRIEPAPAGHGVEFQIAREVLGTMPFAFFTAVEETVHETLHQGLYGWQVTDCTVTLTHTGYFPRQSHAHAVFDKSMSSTAGDFRNLTPLVLMSALQRAGTTVYEPLHHFHLELPADTLGVTLAALARLGAVPQPAELRGSSYLLAGDLPAAHVHELQQQLPELTRGEGVLECVFDSYAPVRGTVSTRARTDHNPLDRKEYLLRVTRRV